MIKLKKYATKVLTWITSLVFYILLLMVLNYTGILKFKMIIKFNFIIIAAITFIFGIFNGKKCPKKGYIEGLKQGGLIVLILTILNIIFIRKFSLNILIYYLIIIISSIIGCIIGINLKKK